MFKSPFHGWLTCSKPDPSPLPRLAPGAITARGFLRPSRITSGLWQHGSNAVLAPSSLSGHRIRTPHIEALSVKTVDFGPKSPIFPFVPIITPEIARSFGVRSGEVRRALAIERKQVQAMPDPAPVQTESDYLQRRLSRVREQIDRVSDMLDAETDPQRLDRLAAALERLTELERKLDNRPLPGSRRPGKEPTRRPAGATAEPSA